MRISRISVGNARCWIFRRRFELDCLELLRVERPIVITIGSGAGGVPFDGRTTVRIIATSGVQFQHRRPAADVLTGIVQVRRCKRKLWRRIR